MKIGVGQSLSEGGGIDVGTGDRCIGYRKDFCRGHRVGLWCRRHWELIQSMKEDAMEPIERTQLAPDGHPFKVWWECSNCHGHVGKRDAFCCNCGGRFGSESPQEDPLEILISAAGSGHQPGKRLVLADT